MCHVELFLLRWFVGVLTLFSTRQAPQEFEVDNRILLRNADEMRAAVEQVADAIISEVMDAVHEFEYEQNDDQTLILIRYEE